MTLLLIAAGCSAAGGTANDNPFLANLDDPGKEDSAYLNPDGIEVEVDLEGDIMNPQGAIGDGPATLGQFTTTYMRKNGTMYIESIAEDAHAANRSEWLIDGTWYPADQIPQGATPQHWRLRGLDAVLLFSASQHPEVGQVFTASVPLSPFTVFNDAGRSCADDDDHIGLDQVVYWYRWEPGQSGCTVAKQDLQVTVSKTFTETTSTVYPEFDKLLADGKLTTVILFGEIDDGPITEDETGMRNFRRYGTWLTEAGFAEVPAPLGKRYEKVIAGITVQMDLYSPNEFSGLSDFAHFGNWQTAISDHEIVVWDGHSMLGASNFWTSPQYPPGYQIFLYGGCLGYEYYVQAILHGKGDSWQNVDIMSSVVEVTASANEFAAPALAKIVWALDHANNASWRSILMVVRDSVGDSTFGVSGVRDNCYTPSGPRC
jgi:hypothetical protein